MVITRAYDALSKHAHSCSGIICENLAALKTLNALSVSSPEPTHCFVPYINTNVGQGNHIHLAPKNLFRFSTVLTKKTAVLGFGSVTVTALILIDSLIEVKTLTDNSSIQPKHL